MGMLAAVSRFVGRTFALWVLGVSALAYAAPEIFRPVVPYIIWLLGVVMFGMGLTLAPADFAEVARRPREVALGVAAQFTVMPLLAFALTRIVPMSPEIAAGVVLVGCCPGGTASNVMTFLAKGDVALSVTLTTVSTLLAPFVTPFLVWVFASQYLPVDAASMFLSIVKVILVPLALGAAVKALFPRAGGVMLAAMPTMSAAVVVLIIAAVGRGQPAEAGAGGTADRRGGGGAQRRRPGRRLFRFARGGHGAGAAHRRGDRGGDAEQRPRRGVGAGALLAARRGAERDLQRDAERLRRGIHQPGAARRRVIFCF